MEFTRISIPITVHERERLRALAKEKERDPRQLARAILRSALGIVESTQGNEKPATGLVYEAETVSGFTVSQPL